MIITNIKKVTAIAEEYPTCPFTNPALYNWNTTVVVALEGPPLVSTYTCVNTFRELMITDTRTYTSVFFNPGTVI